MNKVKSIYCRVYQTALRIALPFLPYRNPKILHSVAGIPGLLIEKGLGRPLLVTDQSIRGLGLTKQLEKALQEDGLEAAVYDETQQNPTTKMVMDALGIYRDNACDCIIAFGGGCINDTLIHLATSEMGFGGMGESGMGSYHGKRGFETFTHRKSIVDKKTFLDLPMRYQPYTAWKDKLVRMFVK